jgi:hypothetical protein
LPFHHKVLEGAMKCSDCHNPHGGFELNKRAWRREPMQLVSSVTQTSRDHSFTSMRRLRPKVALPAGPYRDGRIGNGATIITITIPTKF